MFQKTSFYSLLLKGFGLVALVTVLQACTKPAVLVEEERFVENEVIGHPALQTHYFQQGAYRVRYVTSGNPAGATIVFLHGTPGGWESGSRYLLAPELQRENWIVSVDRPGWGGSGLPEGREASFSLQERLLKPVLEQANQNNDGQGVILIGHSYGAPLAAYIAMQNPELVSGLMLLAGSFDPQLGKPRWYNRAATMGAVSWFLSDGMRHANREIIPLQNELQTMHNKWTDLTLPVTVIQGLKDRLVYPENADFAQRVLVNADLKVIRLPASGHFIPWAERTLVIQEIHHLLARVKPVANMN